MSLPAELSLRTAVDVLKAAPALTAGGVLDLSGVTRADSAGISLLLELTRRAGGSLKFSGAPQQVVQLARFFGVDSVLSFQ